MKRCGTSFGSDRPRNVQPRPCLSFITLITYQLSFYSCSVLPWLAVAYPSHNLTTPYCWLINIRDSIFSIFFCSLHQSFFWFCLSDKKIDFLRFLPLGLISHFSLFYLQLPFNPSRLHFSQLASPACFCLLVWPLCQNSMSVPNP